MDWEDHIPPHFRLKCVTEPVVWWVTVFSSSGVRNFHSKCEVKYNSLILIPQHCDLLLTCKVLGKVEWLLCLRCWAVIYWTEKPQCWIPQRIFKDPAKFLAGSHRKELIEGTQRKAGVFAFTINNLRANKDALLLKIWKGNGNFVRIFLRDFLGKGCRVRPSCIGIEHTGAECSHYWGKLLCSLGRGMCVRNLLLTPHGVEMQGREVAASLSACMGEAK